jgi:hypothetical protein
MKLDIWNKELISVIQNWERWMLGRFKIDVLVNLGYFDLDARGKPVDTWALSILDAQTVEDFSITIQAYNSKYWNRLNGTGYEQSLCVGLCSYPDFPYMCMMVYGACPPEPWWWLRFRFHSIGDNLK